MAKLPSYNFKNKKIAIIDDTPSARESMADIVLDADLEPIIIQEKPGELVSFIKDIVNKFGGAVFDQRLKPHNFANFNGAEAVAKLYDEQFPSLLVTALSTTDIQELRPFRRKIPILLFSNEVESHSIIEGFEVCIKEFKNEFISTRKPRNTLIRINEIYAQSAYVTIPAWDPSLRVGVPLFLIQKNIDGIKIVEGLRLFADINLGAELDEELYFENFTLADKPTGAYAKLLRS